MNNMEEVIKFSENHQKQEITVVEPTDEITTKLFQFLHKSDVRMMLCVFKLKCCYTYCMNLST